MWMLLCYCSVHSVIAGSSEECNKTKGGNQKSTVKAALYIDLLNSKCLLLYFGYSISIPENAEFENSLFQKSSNSWFKCWKKYGFG